MHAEPDPIPTGAGDKFPIDFGGLGLGSGSSRAEGSPGSCCHPRAGKSSCFCPGGLWSWCLALEVAGNLVWQIFAAVQVVNSITGAGKSLQEGKHSYFRGFSPVEGCNEGFW